MIKTIRADETEAVSHDRQPDQQVHQNADHRVHQPDQRRERNHSGIIKRLIHLQFLKVLFQRDGI